MKNIFWVNEGNSFTYLTDEHCARLFREDEVVSNNSIEQFSSFNPVNNDTLT